MLEVLSPEEAAARLRQNQQELEPGLIYDNACGNYFAVLAANGDRLLIVPLTPEVIINMGHGMLPDKEWRLRENCDASNVHNKPEPFYGMVLPVRAEEANKDL